LRERCAAAARGAPLPTWEEAAQAFLRVLRALA
jgi:hypothetical protein